MPTQHADDMASEAECSQGNRGRIIPQSSKTHRSLWVDTVVDEASLASAARLCRDVAPKMHLALRQSLETLSAQTVGHGRKA
jgi:hypothetical protein